MCISPVYLCIYPDLVFVIHNVSLAQNFYFMHATFKIISFNKQIFPRLATTLYSHSKRKRTMRFESIEQDHQIEVDYQGFENWKFKYLFSNLKTNKM